MNNRTGLESPLNNRTIGEIVEQVRANSETGEVYASLNDDHSMVEFFGAYVCEAEGCEEKIRSFDGTPWVAVRGYSADQIATLADHLIGRYDLNDGDVTEDGEAHCGCLNQK